ncbi:helix-turn-helix transcriptional regulator [Streptomyces sp. IBSBF 2435]|uniref:helix-turn-helix transcriptional regulator n=1 Tax=Streptomyces sp. IBSBF 2435 TaxID=2903531 RepID=UPI002FDC6827
MPAHPLQGVGRRLAARRRARNLTQSDLAQSAQVSYATVRSIERGSRMPSDDVLDALAAALAVEPGWLATGADHTDSRIHLAMPALSAAVADYDVPADGPVRPLVQLYSAVADAVSWRLGSQYVRLAAEMPALLQELARALQAARGRERIEVAGLLVAAYRAADAAAYKSGHRDLSARLVDLMRWAAAQAESDLLAATTAYVRTEVFFGARAHQSGLRALEAALEAAPRPVDAPTTAARGALHMRAAVIAGRAADADAAAQHMADARRLADDVAEGVYLGTAFGPASVRIHEVSTAVSMGASHIHQALEIAQVWAPPRDMPAERRSAFYIEVGRAQLWAGRRTDSFESLRVARRIAPQHTRAHPWVREDIGTLRRLQRAGDDDLTRFAERVGAV